MTDCLGLAPEPSRYRDLPDEPLEDRAFEQALVGVSPGRIRPRKTLLGEPRSKKVRALDDCLRNGGRYNHDGGLHAGKPSPDEIGPAHDASGRTLAAASTLEKELRGSKSTKTEEAAVIGRLVAERAKTAGVERVVFDRAGFRYHGRIKSLAEAAREAGLEF